VSDMLAVSLAGLPKSNLYCPVCCGGRVSLTCGMVPAIEVSGIPTFRGRGIGDSREYGWYAVLVCIFRFDDEREACAEEKVRKTCWQGRSEDVADNETIRETILDGEASGTNTR